MATAPPMPRWQRAYLTACAGVIGFAAAYVLCDFAAWPRLTYYPYGRSWGFVSGPPGELPMSYVGTALWGAGGGVLAATIAWVGCALANRPLTDRWLQLWGGWALATFAYAGMYYTWNLWPF